MTITQHMDIRHTTQAHDTAHNNAHINIYIYNVDMSTAYMDDTLNTTSMINS